MTVVALLLALAGATEAGNLCTLCHPDVRVEFERGIHYSEDVTCVSCHGGDATASTVAAAHRGDFQGKIQRADVPRLCASCHADAEQMRPYNLPTDQFALYQTSQHGRGLAQGNQWVAVCTDCHGAHEILRRDDRRSPINPVNIPEMCARCHSDAGLRGEAGLEGDPYADFVASRHGEALLVEENPAAPDCARCHGAHGATPPGVGDVQKVCGQCHGTTRAYFREGPHRDALATADLPECASCHHHHRVMRAGVELLGTVCARCHDPGSRPVELGLEMETLYTSAAADVDSARAVMEQAAAVPLYIEDYEARLQLARTSLVESLPAMHSLDVEVLKQLTGRSRSIGQEVESEIRGKLEGRKWRRVGLMVFWFYLLVTVAILVRFRRRAAHELGP